VSHPDFSKICVQCGMCCNGVLTPKVGITLKEREAARRHGLRVMQGQPFFELPCPKLVDNCCTIYEERPGRCRLFLCDLLATHEKEGLTIEQSLAKIHRMKELAAQLRERGLEPKRGASLTVDGADALELLPLLQEYSQLIEENLGRASPMFTDDVPKEAYTVPDDELQPPEEGS
jgi:hypothetical protein